LRNVDSFEKVGFIFISLTEKYLGLWKPAQKPRGILQESRRDIIRTVEDGESSCMRRSAARSSMNPNHQIRKTCFNTWSLAGGRKVPALIGLASGGNSIIFRTSAGTIVGTRGH
jgi:hypothetical protein